MRDSFIDGVVSYGYPSEKDLNDVFLWDTPVETSDHVLNYIEASPDLRAEFDELCPPWLGAPDDAFNGLRAFTNARKGGEASLHQLAADPGQPEWVRRWARAGIRASSKGSAAEARSVLLTAAPGWLAEALESLSEKYGWPPDQTVFVPSESDVPIGDGFSLTRGAETYHGKEALAGATASGHFGEGETLTPAYLEVQAIDETTLKVTVEVDPRDKRGTETYLLAGSPSKGVWRSVPLTEREDGMFEGTTGGEFVAFVRSLEDPYYAVLFSE